MSLPTPEQNPQRKMGLVMSLLAWAILLGIVSLAFHDWLGNQANPNQHPVSQATGGVKEVSLRPNRQHHYVVNGLINNQPVTFMLDTGATDVVIPSAVARKLALRKGYPGTAQTANGPVTVYSTQLNSIVIGDIRLADIRASINPGMDADVVLLGMSALRQIEFTQRGEVLVLRQFHN